MEKICVAVRVRPSSMDGLTHWKIEDNRISLHRTHGTPVPGVSYAFDYVFDETCTNARVYELLTKDIIHAAIEGFNGTAFAYGQTSSGKTYTMKGSSNDPGIIHLAVEDVFHRIQTVTDREFLIRVSYMEIYNEEINDLLCLENQKLQIHESLEHGVFVAGLKEEVVNSADQVIKLIESGEANRHFGETNMNARSSRSHTIFRMVIESRGKESDLSDNCWSSDAIRVSVLNLVDLAGSERIAKTGADGVRLKEGKHINKSLMILGNVINKLSDGGKIRGHIPYRDSKLTRILQPALGGNAKTSVICTIAPEEDHIEESRGTLQFASRATRITNCAQINEILTDAGLLKRQKLEIEALRRKLQGSHPEMLEQQILKLRNEILKYEQEREKLVMQLKEERKSQEERDQCIREQQLKIENLGNLLSMSDSERNLSKEKISARQSSKLESLSNGKDIFGTPGFPAGPNSAFVARRSNYSRLSDCSPLPTSFSTVADEDTWIKMNKGYAADLDSLQITPNRLEALSSRNSTPECSYENHKEDVENLKREIELLTEQRDNLERKYNEQALFNDQLLREISELKQVQEVPQRLCESVVVCKEAFEDISSSMIKVVPDEESWALTLLSATTKVGMNLLSTLEEHFSTVLGNDGNFVVHASLIEEQHELVRKRLESELTFLLGEARSAAVEQGCLAEREAACLGEKLDELNGVKEKYDELEKEVSLTKQLLEVSEERYSSLGKEFQVLKEERDLLAKQILESSQKLALINDEKENSLKVLASELERRQGLQEGIKQLSEAFAHRQRLFMSFHSEIKSRIEKLGVEKQG